MPQHIVSIVILIISVFLLSNVASSRRIPLKKEFMYFPVQIGEYVGNGSTMDSEMEKATGVDDYLLADYLKPSYPPINVYIPYYEKQGMDIAGLDHTPSACLRGGGWEVLDEKIIKIQVPTLPKPLKLKRLIVKKYDEEYMVFYWFYQRGRIMASARKAKIYQVYDAITKKRSDGAMIRLMTKLCRYEQPPAAEKRLIQFTQALVPILVEYLPD